MTRAYWIRMPVEVHDDTDPQNSIDGPWHCPQWVRVDAADQELAALKLTTAIGELVRKNDAAKEQYRRRVQRWRWWTASRVALWMDRVRHSRILVRGMR